MNTPAAENWKGKNVLVTGANGFLGSWVTKALVDAGARVVCLLKEELPLSLFNLTGMVDQVTTIWGALEDYPTLERIIGEFGIHTCFHLAAQPIVTTAQREPLLTFETNVRGTWNLLEAVRRSGRVIALVVASSDKVYGETEKPPYTEENPLLGRDPYDVSKVCVDVLAQSYLRTYGLPIGIARCGNFYGPGDFHWGRIIPGTIRSLVSGTNPVVRSDGTYIRDYFYVEDAASAFLTFAEQLDRPEVQGQAFNFGTETPTRVLEVVGRLTEISGKRDLTPIILNEARGEIKEQYLSCAKARRLLNWSHRTDLSEGLSKTYSWYEKFLTQNRLSTFEEPLGA